MKKFYFFILLNLVSQIICVKKDLKESEIDLMIITLQILNNKIKGPIIQVRLPSEYEPVTRCHLLIFGGDNDEDVQVEPLYDREINFIRNYYSGLEYTGNTDNSCSFQIDSNILRKEGYPDNFLNKKFRVVHSNCKNYLDDPEKCIKEYSFYINSPSWWYSMQNMFSSWPIITRCGLLCELELWKKNKSNV